MTWQRHCTQKRFGGALLQNLLLELRDGDAPVAAPAATAAADAAERAHIRGRAASLVVPESQRGALVDVGLMSTEVDPIVPMFLPWNSPTRPFLMANTG